ncbi:25S rRNA (adenine(645)-N(1))-methyltransferase [Purpureocillium takamizusanense]|uniref:Ribosomal RNA-processing protein 8 n=1 Tax=Purpureocillium takamizusanense TaxID=2060973 RepID=A0A9Q8VDZ8_9HYPO|nr:25S rRNA (adenine(645)-N(1))-methyltransferase [Purpureocillium takamizusanense]UNI21756.1 25S rRNA (adenine(645)-N(1))-methyltransferase [Purpureocillium takamizusanense]
MFAVPGWSVSADSLKAENTSSAAATSAQGPAAGAKSRKRKRNAEAVTASNVVDLYESVVEGRKAQPPPPSSSKQPKEKPSKKARKEDGAGGGKKAQAEVKKSQEHAADVDGGEGKKKETKPEGTETGEAPKESKKDKKKKNKQKGNNESRGAQPSATEEEKQQSRTGNNDVRNRDGQPSMPPPKPATSSNKLTPLQASMREKLVSARFRHLNETLYTRPSEEAFELFQESPEMFDEYHEGFRRQVKVWPENPVDSFLADIRARAKVRQPGRHQQQQRGGRGGGRGRGGRQASASESSRGGDLPLPRTAGLCTIADLGCGDARLAESLRAEQAKLNVEVKSFDLQSPSPLVTRADIADLPLADGSVNVAIFCLALMGTNWIDFIEEAYRVLHWKGELWVAEIKSRFGPPSGAAGKRAAGGGGGVVAHSVGNRKKAAAATTSGKKGGKKGGAGADDDPTALHGQDLAVEVDGVEDRRRETDVSAFVEALRRRGFVLRGERAEAVDMSNRMFVKMHFIKGAAPTKGKGVKAAAAAAAQEGGTRGGKKKTFAPKWDEGDQDDDEAGVDASEAAILKPCVYKIR